MALIPTLGQQILAEMDVEGVTRELQSKSRTPRSPVDPSPPSESSLASSIDILPDHDSRSDAGSVSISSFSGSGRESNMGEPWVDQFSPRPEASLQLHEPGGLDLSQSTHLSESISTTNSALSQHLDRSGRVRKIILSHNVDIDVLILSRRV